MHNPTHSYKRQCSVLQSNMPFIVKFDKDSLKHEEDCYVDHYKPKEILFKKFCKEVGFDYDKTVFF